MQPRGVRRISCIFRTACLDASPRWTPSALPCHRAAGSFFPLHPRATRNMSYDDAQVTPRGNDKGVDVVASIEMGITTVKVVIQVKRVQGKVQRPVLDARHWVGEDRKIKTLIQFFRWFGKERTLGLKFVCSDMWHPYIRVLASLRSSWNSHAPPSQRSMQQRPRMASVEYSETSTRQLTLR